MTDTKNAKGPVEVWLRQINMAITCTIVHEDESTEETEIESLSFRGAQREISGYFVSHGYEPAGRWEDQEDDQRAGRESMRQFKPKPPPTARSASNSAKASH